MEEQKQGWLKANAGTIMNGIQWASNLLGIGHKKQDRRQVAQQKRLNEVGEASSKRLADYDHELKMKMWNDTNYGAQLAQAEKAGVSKAAAIGGGGAGVGQATTVGSTSGGQAADAAATENANTNKAMALAQMANIQANTEKTKAETQNIAPQGDKIKADTAATQWQTDLSKKLNTDTFINDVQKQQQWAAEKIDNENTKWKADWEAYQQGAFDGKKWDDPNTPMAKAIKAGFEQTVTNAQKAKAENNVAKAEAEIKGYEAKLTRQGIAAGSPWYVKIMGDLLGKLGINLTGDTAAATKRN